VGQFKVEKDGRYDWRVGEERQNLHFSATSGAEQREHLIDACEEHGPADAGRAGRSDGLVVALGWRLLSRSQAGGLAVRCVGFRSADGDDGSAKFGVGCQHTVVSVPVDARGRDESGESLEELDG